MGYTHTDQNDISNILLRLKNQKLIQNSLNSLNQQRLPTPSSSSPAAEPRKVVLRVTSPTSRAQITTKTSNPSSITSTISNEFTSSDIVILSDDENSTDSTKKVKKNNKLLTKNNEKLIKPTTSESPNSISSIECVVNSEEDTLSLPVYVIPKKNQKSSETVVSRLRQKPQLKNHQSTSTIPPWPKRSRSIQNEIMVTEEKSIQCDILKPDLIHPGYFYINLEENDDHQIESLQLDSGSNNEQSNDINDNKSIKIHSNSKYECLVCGEISNKSDYIRNHFENNHKETSVLCFNCGTTFDNERSLEKHEKTKKCMLENNEEENQEICKEKKRKQVEERRKLKFCPYPLCGYINTTPFGINDHINYYHLKKQKLYKCSCGKSYNSYEAYYVHLKLTKCNSNSQKMRNLIFNQSNYRIYTFKKKTVVYRIKLFKSIKNLCKYCHKIFKNSFELSNHIRKNHLEKSKCILCSKFVKMKYLKSHLKDHKIDLDVVILECD